MVSECYRSHDGITSQKGSTTLTIDEVKEMVNPRVRTVGMVGPFPPGHLLTDADLERLCPSEADFKRLLDLNVVSVEDHNDTETEVEDEVEAEVVPPASATSGKEVVGGTVEASNLDPKSADVHAERKKAVEKIAADVAAGSTSN